MMNLSNTTRLLLHCVQLNVTDNMRAEIKTLVRQPIDWKAFEDAAMWHGVAPLAFNGLKNVQARHLLPAQLFETLKSEYRKNLIRNTLIFSELEKIIAALGELPVPVVLLKGAAITKMIYKDIGLRPMSDIDILVKKENIYQAVQAIESRGYRQHDRENLEQLLNTKYHIVYIHPGTNILLEIHWDISSDHNPSLIRSNVPDLMDKWWSRVSNEVTGFDHVFHLHPIDLICLVSTHFFKHRFIRTHTGFSTNGGLLQLCDLMNIICYYRDGNSLVELSAESRKMRFHSAVSVANWTLKTIFKDAIDVADDGFFRTLGIADSDKAIALYVAKRICDMEDKQTPVPIGLFHTPDNASYMSRVTRFAKEVFPDPATLSAKLNRPIGSNWFYLNYLYRPFHLLKRHGKTLMNRHHLKEEGLLKQWINGNDS